MSKEKIMPIIHEVETPQRSEAEIQQYRITDLISRTNEPTEINQIIMSRIHEGRKKAQQSKK